MAQLSTKIKEYAKANGVNSIDFLSEVNLQDDGSGAYIKKWNLDIPEPTDEQLATYEDEANAEEALNTVYSNRQAEYPSWQDQMDMQYWDKINNTSTWQDAIQAVKDKYPKS